MLVVILSVIIVEPSVGVCVVDCSVIVDVISVVVSGTDSVIVVLVVSSTGAFDVVEDTNCGTLSVIADVIEVVAVIDSRMSIVSAFGFKVVSSLDGSVVGGVVTGVLSEVVEVLLTVSVVGGLVVVFIFVLLELDWSKSKP